MTTPQFCAPTDCLTTIELTAQDGGPFLSLGGTTVKQKIMMFLRRFDWKWYVMMVLVFFLIRCMPALSNPEYVYRPWFLTIDLGYLLICLPIMACAKRTII